MSEEIVKTVNVFDDATPDQIERANAAVTANLDENGDPLWQSAQGYACALTAIMQTDASRTPSSPTKEMVEAPVDAPEAMWDGLPRAIMMWLSFPSPTPRALFDHLRCSGYDIPAWMEEEGELKALDHVPSKGTRCVLIYRSMIENWKAQAALSAISGVGR